MNNPSAHMPETLQEWMVEDFPYHIHVWVEVPNKHSGDDLMQSKEPWNQRLKD